MHLADSGRALVHVCLWCLVIFTVWRTAASTDVCIAGSDIPGTITPRNVIVKSGSALVLKCTLFLKKIKPSLLDNGIVNSSNIVFKFKNQTFDKFIDIIDERSAILRVNNVSNSHGGRWGCYANISKIKEPQLICQRTVFVAERPEVKNFACIVHYKKSIDCSWDAPSFAEGIRYKLEHCYYRDEDCEKASATCANSSIRDCTVDGKREFSTNHCSLVNLSPQLVYNNLHFQLKSKNIINESNTQHFCLKYGEIVLLPAPKNFRSSDISSRYILLTWKPLGDLTIRTGVLYEISYKAEFHSDWTVISHVDRSPKDASLASLKITNLAPFTSYKIRSRCRSLIADGNDMWSDYSYIDSLTTMPDVPTVVPKSLPEAYFVQEKGDRRNITVYWQAVSREHYNGPEFGYKVEVIKRPSSNSNIFYKKDLPENGTQVHVEGLDPRVSYEFRIRAKNSVGNSSNFTSITVRGISEPAPKPRNTFALCRFGNKCEISWIRPPGEIEVVNYTVFWCLKSFKSTGCEQLHWKRVLPEEGYSCPLDVLPKPYTEYQFGVAAYTEDRNSGIVWANCIQNKVIEHVRLHEPVTTDSSVVELTWDFGCKHPEAVIQNYSLSYCIMKQTGNDCIEKETTKKFVVTGSIYTYKVDQLKPNKNYTFRLDATTEDGIESSNSVKVLTNPAAPDDAPREVVVTNVTSQSFVLSWLPSLKTHGAITHYNVNYFAEHEDSQQFKTVRILSPSSSSIIQQHIHPYTNYTVWVTSCYKKSCSPKSDYVRIATDVGEPGEMGKPNVRQIQDAKFNITWKVPKQPNGPIDFYEIHVGRTNLSKEFEKWNASGLETHLVIPMKCPPHRKGTEGGYYYDIQVRAVNLAKDESPLYGPFSDPASVDVCTETPAVDWAFIIGILVGVTVALLVLIIAVFRLVVRMKPRYPKKRVIVELPAGLKSPADGAPLMFEHRNKCSTVSDQMEIKYTGGLFQPVSTRFGAVIRFTCGFKQQVKSRDLQRVDASATDALLNKHVNNNDTDNVAVASSGDQTDGTSSGISSTSSCSTEKTKVSFCSETEMNIPASPDSVFSDPFHCDTANSSDVEACQDFGSDDSGIAREDVIKSSQEHGDNKFVQYSILGISKTKLPQVEENPCSGVIPNNPGSPTFPYLLQCSPAKPYLLQCSPGLANSEPSLPNLEEDMESDSSLKVNSDKQPLPPYVKFPFGRSSGNVAYATTNPSDDTYIGTYSRFSVTGAPETPVGVYSKFGLKRVPMSVSKNPYVTMNMIQFGTSELEINDSSSDISTKPNIRPFHSTDATQNVEMEVDRGAGYSIIVNSQVGAKYARISNVPVRNSDPVVLSNENGVIYEGNIEEDNQMVCSDIQVPFESMSNSSNQDHQLSERTTMNGIGPSTSGYIKHCDLAKLNKLNSDVPPFSSFDGTLQSSDILLDSRPTKHLESENSRNTDLENNAGKGVSA